jgi:hypothetical protein
VLEIDAPLLVDLGGAVRFRKHLHANLGATGLASASVGIRDQRSSEIHTTSGSLTPFDVPTANSTAPRPGDVTSSESSTSMRDWACPCLGFCGLMTSCPYSFVSIL